MIVKFNVERKKVRWNDENTSRMKPFISDGKEDIGFISFEC